MPRTPSAQHKQMRKFARSADKRQSVHMLGSIQHLQRHFMKFGLAAEEGSDAMSTDIGSFPSLGSLCRTNNANTTGADGSVSIAEPPATVAKPPFPLETPKLDLGKLRREAFESLQALEQAWRIDNERERPKAPSSPREQSEDEEVEPSTRILDLLKTTVDAVRSVRAWSLAVPATSLICSSSSRQSDHIRTCTIPAKSRIPTISTPSRPAPAYTGGRSVSGTSVRLAARNGDGELLHGGGEEKDPLFDLRKAALDVLACLRGVEEKFRTTADSADNTFEDLPLEDLPHEQETRDGPTSGSPKRQQQQQQQSPVLEAPPSSKPPQVEPSTIPAKRIEDSEDLWFFSQRAGDATDAQWAEEGKKGWYERLKSGEGGWTYRDDVRVPAELQEEREVVRRYLWTVVETFFGSAEGSVEIPWRAMKGGEVARGPVISEAEAVGDPTSYRSTEGEVKALPKWSDSQLWEGRRIDRIRAFLQDYLPSNMLDSLPVSESQDERMKLLTRLSLYSLVVRDGFLLILAFNTVLRRSTTGSWGFVPDEDVYDTLDSGTAAPADSIIAEEGTLARKQKDWTFRKAGNLRCWGAVPLTFPLQAVDLQLVIPVISTVEKDRRPSTTARQPSSSPSRRVSNHVVADTADTRLEEGTGTGIPFDPIRIARREERWDGMLEAAVVAWVEKVSLELLPVVE
ncbi:hypothetical protein QFC22_004742 [Naganishia vaughanmartiniae]|uniref:Uncharacterized protein n=1 Tax=Naganishia vaughanmartiniae TaxID=1424756 RepID=A0ACC2WXC5_9TREE|nr:hypothetical protein QFC22_004742 [Naganishia vaughanmartiniae]